MHSLLLTSATVQKNHNLGSSQLRNVSGGQGFSTYDTAEAGSDVTGLLSRNDINFLIRRCHLYAIS